MDSLKTALSTALAETLADALADSGLNEPSVAPANPQTNLIPSSLQESPVSDPVISPMSQTTLSAVQARYMTEHATCAMCDSTLEVRHDANVKDLKVKEEAHCPSCGIRVRSSHHLMH